MQEHGERVGLNLNRCTKGGQVLTLLRPIKPYMLKQTNKPVQLNQVQNDKNFPRISGNWVELGTELLSREQSQVK